MLLESVMLKQIITTAGRLKRLTRQRVRKCLLSVCSSHHRLVPELSWSQQLQKCVFAAASFRKLAGLRCPAVF